MIKPDGVQRGLVGEIIKRFEQKGYKLIAMKLTAPGAAHMETHYEDLKTKKFFPGLISYMTSGPVCAMVWEGGNVVLEGRKMLGATMVRRESRARDGPATALAEAEENGIMKDARTEDLHRSH